MERDIESLTFAPSDISMQTYTQTFHSFQPLCVTICGKQREIKFEIYTFLTVYNTYYIPK